MLQKLPTGSSGPSSAAVFNSPGSQLNSVCAFFRKVCVQKPSVLLKGSQPKVLAGSRAWTPSRGCFRLRWVQSEPCYSGACPHEIAPPRNMGTPEKPQVPTFPSLASTAHLPRYGCPGALGLPGRGDVASLARASPGPWRQGRSQPERGWGGGQWPCGTQAQKGAEQAWLLTP